jgi:hypothetical protein
MKVYVVYPSARAGWELLREGDRDSLHFEDKDAAVSYGRCLADANRPSTLKVETPYGQVEVTWTFDATERVRKTQAYAS